MAFKVGEENVQVKVNVTRADLVLAGLKQTTEATAKQLAPILGMKVLTVSQVLGNLFWQGKVTRERLKPTHAINFEYIYRVKVVSPPVVPEMKVLFPVRLAGRETDRAEA